MNKAEAKQAQSLEEILASIRKALAEEAVQGTAEAPASAEPERAAEKKPFLAAKADPLPGQLAGALKNGSRGGDYVPDDDLADLLAPLPAKDADAAPDNDAEAAPPQTTADKKDPLWFLARKSEADGSAEDAESKVEKKAEKPAELEEPTAKAADASLTRLEALRSSLPPLFGADEPAAAKAEPAAAPQPASAAKAKPAVIPEFKPADKTKTEKPEAKAPSAEKAPATQAAFLEPPVKAAMSPSSSGMLQPPGAAAALPDEVVAAAIAEARPSPAKAAPIGSAQARALEEMIGQLIGPVIHNWLDANLPRLVEKVVREEVARMGSKREPAKD